MVGSSLEEAGGERLGQYRLIRQLATGGMAEIYVATVDGVAGFEKNVALKVIHPNYSADPDFVRMLVDEAKLAVQLQHANIVQTHDLGRVDESYYIVMELIDGVDLFRILRRLAEVDRHLPLDVAGFIAEEVAAGLDYAHRKTDVQGRPLQIIHRDVSPQNILVSRAGEVKIVDFGIAKAARRATHTAAGVIKGKYYYMSPEQAWGDPMDARSDIFSTGILLHEMIAGEMLYFEEDIEKVLDLVRKAEIAPPSTRRSGVPRELDAIVMRALQRRPRDRFQTAGEMSHALQGWLRSYRPDFTAARVGGFVRDLVGAAGEEPEPSGPATGELSLPSLVDEHSLIFKLPDLITSAGLLRRSSAATPALTPLPGIGGFDDGVEETMVDRSLPRAAALHTAPDEELEGHTRPVPSAPARPSDLAPFDDEGEVTRHDGERPREATATTTEVALPGMPDPGYTPTVESALRPITTPAHLAPREGPQARSPRSIADGAAPRAPRPGAVPVAPREPAPAAPRGASPVASRPAALPPRTPPRPGPGPRPRPASRNLDEDPPTTEWSFGRSSEAALDSEPTPPVRAPTRAPATSSPRPSANRPAAAAPVAASPRPAGASPSPPRPVSPAPRPSPTLPAPQPAPRPVAAPSPRPPSGARPQANQMPAGEARPTVAEVAPPIRPPIAPAPNPAPPPHAAMAPSPSPGVPSRPVAPTPIPVAPSRGPRGVGRDGGGSPPSSSPREGPTGPTGAWQPTPAGIQRGGDPGYASVDAGGAPRARGYLPWILLAVAIAGALVGLAAVLVAPYFESRGSIEVVSLPPEAMVKVDGRLAAGRTPLRVDEVELKFPHHVTVTLPGYETWERDVNFDWGRKDVALHAVLTPLTGVLTVTSNPVGAEAIVNGRYRGRTPLELGDMLPTDSVTVELRLRGYRVERRVLPWNGGRRLELSVPLERARP